eukprot:NODE_209_length_12852_cov_0.583863.p5 type:complete len:111 gc:universal NODE_209_length_12852_cov_0.583863:6764-6432(-)
MKNYVNAYKSCRKDCLHYFENNPKAQPFNMTINEICLLLETKPEFNDDSPRALLYRIIIRVGITCAMRTQNFLEAKVFWLEHSVDRNSKPYFVLQIYSCKQKKQKCITKL